MNRIIDLIEKEQQKAMPRVSRLATAFAFTPASSKDKERIQILPVSDRRKAGFK